MTAPIDVLVVTGGHPFDADPFFAVFDAIDGIAWTAASAAGRRPRRRGPVRHARASLHPGRSTGRAARTDRRTAERHRGLCADGVGLVCLHHAVAAWPAWPEYAELVGARFHYTPGSLGGRPYPDSGYRFDVTHTVEVLAPEHPVCAGLGASFTLTDELYCFPVVEQSVTPLLRTTFPTSDTSQFWSADLAIRGTRNSNAGWIIRPAATWSAGPSPPATHDWSYLQFGDGPTTYADANFRRVVANAISWTAGHD